MSIKRVAILFSLLVTAVFILSVNAENALADTGWTAKYYNNRDLSGSPASTVSETNLDHDWGDGSPNSAVSADNFSAEWTRNLYFAPGNYRFVATTDDGMRVFVDNNPIIDVWYDSQAHTVTADIYLNGGNHDIRVEYYEAGGNALARVNWALVSGGSAVWRGDYFNNTSLSGAPVLSRDEAQINYNWSGSPGSNVWADLFSVRWTSNLSLDAGVYRFTATADDGVRLWVNGQLIIDQWQEQEATSFTADISVAGGSVPVKMEYYENGGTAVAALTWAKVSGTPAPAPQSPTIITNWRGEYFNNRDLAGSPVVVRNDSAIDFVWGSSSPIPNAIDSDHFSVRWTQSVNLAAGNYVFTANSDDGVRVWVNGQQIIDAWSIHNVQPFAGAITLPGGLVEIRMEYYEYTGLAEARLSWSTADGTPPSSVPASQPIGQGVPTTATMSGAIHLTVRSGPGLSNEPVGYLSNGQSVTLLGRDAFTVWIKILEADGTVGWTSGRFLNANAPLSNLPVLID